ncbi:hypothetical protein Leryth_018982 [Lithospermum erythrorhizon]|nr:hypothetical protein Leryth_018982 [Lithospermum erythrorhizon]
MLMIHMDNEKSRSFAGRLFVTVPSCTSPRDSSVFASIDGGQGRGRIRFCVGEFLALLVSPLVAFHSKGLIPPAFYSLLMDR